MESYFETIPLEIEESAMVDGATPQRAFSCGGAAYSAAPGIVTSITLSFIFSWNNFMFAQVLSMEKTKTLPLAIYNFVSYAEVDLGRSNGCCCGNYGSFAIILTMIFQKYVVQGLTMGAVKG